MSGSAAEMNIDLILRDFEREGLAAQGELLKKVCAAIQAGEPRAHITCTITPQYRNMRYWLEDDMRPVDLAREACRQSGRRAVLRANPRRDRRLAPDRAGRAHPNIFTGMQEIHGPLEWISLQDMAAATEVCIKLVQRWAAEPGRQHAKPPRGQPAAEPVVDWTG